MAGGACVVGACVVGACVAGGMSDSGVCVVGWGQVWQEKRQLQRAVRILLECILVIIIIITLFRL